MLIDEIQMPQSRLKISLLQERLSSFNNIPVILKVVQTGIISHEQTHNNFSEIRLLAFHYIFYTNIVHISVRKISFSCLVYCLNRQKVIMLFVLYLSFDQVKLRYSTGMFDCSLNIIICSWQGFEPLREMLSQNI